MKNIDTFVEYDQQGFLAAPNEKSDDFLKRVEALKGFHQKTLDELKDNHSFVLEDLQYVADELISEAECLSCQKQSSPLYHFKVSHVPGFFSNRGLSLLAGGMAIMFVDEEGKFWKNGVFSIFQLKKSFRDKDKFLIYSKDELISHESCHVFRSPLEAVEFEEFFAYQSSSSGFRRIIGPALWSGWDSVFLMILLLLTFVGTVVSFFKAAPSIQALAWLPFGMHLIYLSVRSWRSRARFKKAYNLLDPHCNKAYGPMPVLFRMTDKEINEVSKVKDIKVYLSAKHDLRWQVIKKRFF